MSTATKSMSMSINKDNEVVRTKKRLTAEERQEKGQTEKERRQTAKKRQEKGQTEKERKAYFAKILENEIAQYPASKKQASIVDDLKDDEEVEESSLISGFEMSDPLQLKELITASKMAELITVTNEVNKMCSPTEVAGIW